ncbi:MAG TPA: WD40 repeat domain-containing protein [Xanthobacteraceae bacterium]
MTAESGQTASVVDRMVDVVAGAPVVAVHVIGAATGFVLGEESVLLVTADGGERRVPAHGGGILSACATAAEIVTGGDDGRVVATNAEGATREIAADPKRRWIDQVAVSPAGAVAWSAGRSVFVRTVAGEQRTLDLPSSAGGLAFAPKGFRVAIAHYNGATLWFPNAAAAPETLEWKGSHLGALFSPDGKFLITTMQEPMLHGWRLADGKHMRMSGYSAKVRSVAWTADQKSLATSGSEQLILWPFQGKDGPMGKAPRMLAPHQARVVAVACSPRDETAAVGYADGLIMLVRLSDGAEILARKPDGDPVSALTLGGNPARLAFGTESGRAGILSL